MRIMRPDDYLGPFVSALIESNQCVQSFRHVSIAQVPGTDPPAKHAAVVFFGILNEPCILFGVEEISGRHSSIASRLMGHSTLPIEELFNHFRFTAWAQTQARCMSLLFADAGRSSRSMNSGSGPAVLRPDPLYRDRPRVGPRQTVTNLMVGEREGLSLHIGKFRRHFAVPHGKNIDAPEMPRLSIAHLPIYPPDNNPITAHDYFFGSEVRVRIAFEPDPPIRYYIGFPLDSPAIGWRGSVLENRVVGQETCQFVRIMLIERFVESLDYHASRCNILLG
jgi:hypothetical protein